MENSSERTFFWIIGVAVLGVVIFSTSLNPLKEKNPSWQIIKESVAATVYCNDSDYDSDGVKSIGYAPCVRLTNVTFDSDLGDTYCYSADVEVGGYQGQLYDSIESWNGVGTEYYCVSWTAKYIDPDTNDPSHWRVDFGDNSPSNFVY